MKIKAKTTVQAPPTPPGVATREVMVAIGEQHIAALLARLRRGQGLDDRPMRYRGRVYSPSYASFRRRHGRTTSRRVLLYSGHMYRAIHILDAAAGQYTLGFSDGVARQEAKWQHEMTPWWGISPRDRAAIIRALTRALEARYNKR